MKLKTMQRFLASKGYDLNGKSFDYVRNLYRLYHPTPKQAEVKRQWKSWGGTNRLHHYG